MPEPDALSGKVYDLGQPLFPGMPHFPSHPPFAFTLTKLHGDLVLPNGASSTADMIAMGTHDGTHIDALSHFSCDGKLHDGFVPTQSFTGGVEQFAVSTIEPIFRPGVLFDIAGLEGVDALPEGFVITPAHLEACNVEPKAGGIALIRTGWGRFWRDSKHFITGGSGAVPRGPGPTPPCC